MSEQPSVKKRIIIDELLKETIELKQITQRLKDGIAFIDGNLNKGNAVNAAKGARLYGKLAQEAYERIEKSLFIHEFLTTGASVLINREGRPVKSEDVIGKNLDEYTFVNAYTLQSTKELKDVFGEEYITFVKFK